jgi:hypothetical protein
MDQTLQKRGPNINKILANDNWEITITRERMGCSITQVSWAHIWIILSSPLKMNITM